jgi:hypothetical protein
MPVSLVKASALESLTYNLNSYFVFRGRSPLLHSGRPSPWLASPLKPQHPLFGPGLGACQSGGELLELWKSFASWRSQRAEHMWGLSQEAQRNKKAKVAFLGWGLGGFLSVAGDPALRSTDGFRRQWAAETPGSGLGRAGTSYPGPGLGTSSKFLLQGCGREEGSRLGLGLVKSVSKNQWGGGSSVHCVLCASAFLILLNLILPFPLKLHSRPEMKLTEYSLSHRGFTLKLSETENQEAWESKLLDVFTVIWGYGNLMN